MHYEKDLTIKMSFYNELKNVHKHEEALAIIHKWHELITSKSNAISIQEQEKIQRLLNTPNIFNFIRLVLHKLETANEISCYNNGMYRLCCHVLGRTLGYTTETVKRNKTILISCTDVAYHGSFKEAYLATIHGRNCKEWYRCGCHLVPEKYKEQYQEGLECRNYKAPYTYKPGVRFINMNSTEEQ